MEGETVMMNFVVRGKRVNGVFAGKESFEMDDPIIPEGKVKKIPGWKKFLLSILGVALDEVVNFLIGVVMDKLGVFMISAFNAVKDADNPEELLESLANQYKAEIEQKVGEIV